MIRLMVCHTYIAALIYIFLLHLYQNEHALYLVVFDLNIILLVLIAQTYILGFTAYIFRGSGAALTVLPTIIVYLVLRFNNRYSF